MELKVIFLEIVYLDLYSDKVWGFSIFSFCTPPGDISGRPLLSIHCHLQILFGQRPSLIYPRTFTNLPSATSTTPSLQVRICQGGDYHKVLIAPFALILNHSFMLSLVVNSTLIALPGDTTHSLTSLPSHFNL